MDKHLSELYKENNGQRGLMNDTYHNNFRRGCELIITFFVNLFLTKQLKRKPTPSEQKLIDELRENTVNFCHSITTGLKSEDEWMKHAQRTANMIQIDDPRRFLTWNAVKDTMAGSNYLFVLHELKYLKSLPDWETRWKPAIVEDDFGQMPPFFMYPKSSGNLIHHAYVLAKFENMTSKKIDELSFILDYGAGYGSVCRLAHHLGFRGKYLMYDIPVFSHLQAYFLQNIGLKVLPFEHFLTATKGICCISDFKELDTHMQKSLDYKPDKSLLMGMWSISESPLKTRAGVMKHFSLFNYFLFGYQDIFGEVNNHEYFEEIRKKKSELTWKYERLKHLPGHNLLCGQL